MTMPDASLPKPDNGPGTTILARALSDAEALLEFGVRSEKRVPEKIIEAIVKAKAVVARGQPTESEEISFWLAFNELSAIMAPVTAESLRYINEQVPRAWLRFLRPASAAQSVIRRMRSFTILCLLALIFTQIYFLVGSTIVRDAERLTVEWLGVQTEISRVQTANPKIETGDPILKPLEMRETVLSNRIQASYETINSWNSIWGWFASRPIALFGGFVREKPGSVEAAGGDPIAANIRAEQTARFAQQSLALYILPLLYGMLGAFTHILRRLNEQLDVSTLTEGAHYRYRLRLTLGAVAGPAIGLFFSSEKPSTLLSELSPFAIAFIAGYSVDLLFSVADLWIGKLREYVDKKQVERRDGQAAAPARVDAVGAGAQSGAGSAAPKT